MPKKRTPRPGREAQRRRHTGAQASLAALEQRALELAMTDADAFDAFIKQISDAIGETRERGSWDDDYWDNEDWDDEYWDDEYWGDYWGGEDWDCGEPAAADATPPARLDTIEFPKQGSADAGDE